jgi:calcineurin-like phosphoesterase family protein
MELYRKFMKTFWTSDQHIGHRNIIGYCARPFSDVDHMRETIIARYNEMVTSSDLVYHLGDIAMDERLVAPFLARLNGRKILVCGNHDKCHPHRKEHERMRRRYLAYGFEDVLVQAEYEPLQILMCHLPYAGDSEDYRERFPEFRPKDEGLPLLCGHVHEKWRERRMMLNVGVDMHDFRPVTEEQVLAFLSSRSAPQSPP